MQFSVTKDGKILDPSLYVWDEKNRIFSTNRHGLVIDFSRHTNVTFKTGSCCTFKTGANCKFDTGSYCKFDTGDDCVFKTGKNCSFRTSFNCKFDTYIKCIVVRGDNFEEGGSWSAPPYCKNCVVRQHFMFCP